MARVPTWAELRLHVTELAKSQNKCYQSVHSMLDDSIPKLDKKLSLLRGDSDSNRLTELEARFQALSTEQNLAQLGHGIPRQHSGSSQRLELSHNIAAHKARDFVDKPIKVSTRPRRHFSNKNDPTLKPSIKKSSTNPNLNGLQRLQPSPPKPLYEEINDESEPDLDYLRSHGSNGYTRRMSTPEPVVIANTKPKTIDLERPKPIQINGFLRGPLPEMHVYERVEPDLDDLEHLRPPPLPLSHYLRVNRPEVVRSADRRVMYLRKSAEKRKSNASARTINALDQIRASSRTSSNTRGSSSLRSSLRGMTRSQTGPNLTSHHHHQTTKCQLSEQEMKRLTARTYNRLPEVKKQRIQEVTKHLKVQNYKNKLDYGRKLLENRRRGIINYPLRGHHDDSSLMSSLEESVTTDSLERSADGMKFDQYY